MSKEKKEKIDLSNVAFHLAAHLGEWGAWEDFERGNVVGTRNVLAACEEAGVKRFVHCGTEAALMAGEPLIHVDETAPLRPDSRAPYPATKAKAEQAVRGVGAFLYSAEVDSYLLPIVMRMGPRRSGRDSASAQAEFQ